MMKFEQYMDKFNKVEYSIKKQQEVKYLFDSLVKPKEGHPIYEIDLIEQTVRVTEIVQVESVNLLSWKKDIDIFKKQGCLYFSSLNFNNLQKKLLKIDSKFKDFKYIKSDLHPTQVHKHRKVTFLKEN